GAHQGEVVGVVVSAPSTRDVVGSGLVVVGTYAAARGAGGEVGAIRAGGSVPDRRPHLEADDLFHHRHWSSAGHRAGERGIGGIGGGVDLVGDGRQFENPITATKLLSQTIGD